MKPAPYYFRAPDQSLSTDLVDHWMESVATSLFNEEEGRLFLSLKPTANDLLFLTLLYDAEGALYTTGFFGRVYVTHCVDDTGASCWMAPGQYPLLNTKRHLGMYTISLPREVRRLLEAPWADAGLQARLLSWQRPEPTEDRPPSARTRE